MPELTRHNAPLRRTLCRKAILLASLMLVAVPFGAVAQKQAYHWYFGKNAGLDFSGFDPVPITLSQMDAPEGVASIADSSGQLLFYTDGQSIWNSNHERIATNLSGDPASTQSATIVPDPDTIDQYFIFTTRSFDTLSQTNYGGNFYKIRIKSGETGSIIYNYAAATGKDGLWTGLTEKFLAIPFVRADGKTGYWFIMHEFNSDNFVVIKYDGVLHEPDFPVIGSLHQNDSQDDGTNRGASGQMKVNDQRNRIALAVEGGKFFEIFRFDTLSGRIDRPMTIPAGDVFDKFAYRYGAYGVEFSPTGRYGYEATSGNFLYGTSRDGGQVYQWDLSYYDPYPDQSLFIKTGQILYSNPEIECGALQIAPNAKIYVAFNHQDFIGVINAPMRPNCGFLETGARLIDNNTGLGGRSGFGLPAPVPVFRKQEPFYFENLCDGDTTLFHITNQDQNSITPNTPKAWTFIRIGGGANPVTKTSQTMDYRYKFPLPGKYLVRLTVFKAGSPVAYTRELTINPLPTVRLIEGNIRDTVSLCVGTELNFDAGYGAFYEWETDTINDRTRVIADNGGLLNEYRVKVTDYHGCVGWDTLFARREIPPTTAVSSTPAFCARADGIAVVTPNGRPENYEYAWEGFPAVNSNTLSDIPGGQYVVKVTKKSSGCSVMDTVKVEAIGLTDIRVEKSINMACPGELVSVSVTGADAVEWLSHPELTGNAVQLAVDTTTVLRIKTTNYRDERICELEMTDTIHIYPHVKPDLPELFEPCGGHPLLIDGGADFTDWQWSDGQSGQFAVIREDVNSLGLTVSDANGCVFTDATQIRFLPGPTFTLPKDTAFCSKGPVTISGGEGESYQWSRWDSVQTVPLATTRELTITETGHYILSITKTGCTITDTVFVHLNDPDLFRINGVEYDDISCKGAGDGEIRINATGTAGTYFYSIDGGNSFFANGGLFTDLIPGGPYVIVVNEDGDTGQCRQIWPELIELVEPDPLQAKFCSLAPSCPGCNDGVITLGEITGGTPPYTIYLMGIPQDSIIMNLNAGAHLLTVVDANQCSFETSVELLQGTRPEIIPSVTGPVCPGQEVMLRVTNAKQVEWINPPDNFSLEILVKPMASTWYRVKSIVTDLDGFSCETILEYFAEVLPSVPPALGDTLDQCEGGVVEIDGGDYITWDWSNNMTGRYISIMQTTDPLILTVLDGNGCIMTDSVSVLFHPYPVVNLGPDLQVCSAEPVELTGGSGDTYLWSNGYTTQSLFVSVSDTYALTITTKGCSSSDTVRVRVVDPETVRIQNVRKTDSRCFGSDNGTLEIIASGMGSTLAYSIDGGSTWQAENFFNQLTPGVYGQIMVSADSTCFIGYPDAVTIGQPDSIHIGFRLKSPTCETCRDGQLSLTITGGVPPYRISLSGVAAELVTRDLGVGSYVIIVTDANLCTATAEFTLELLNQIPNVITTNGDGINDLWKIPMMKYYPDAVVKVLTTAGELVFESPPGYPVPWDGRHNGSFLPMGTYYYLINLGPGEQLLTGYLTILR